MADFDDSICFEAVRKAETITGLGGSKYVPGDMSFGVKLPDGREFEIYMPLIDYFKMGRPEKIDVRTTVGNLPSMTHCRTDDELGPNYIEELAKAEEEHVNAVIEKAEKFIAGVLEEPEGDQ